MAIHLLKSLRDRETPTSTSNGAVVVKTTTLNCAAGRALERSCFDNDPVEPLESPVLLHPSTQKQRAADPVWQ
jgi:hypothetical protein